MVYCSHFTTKTWSYIAESWKLVLEGNKHWRNSWGKVTWPSRLKYSTVDSNPISWGRESPLRPVPRAKWNLLLLSLSVNQLCSRTHLCTRIWICCVTGLKKAIIDVSITLKHPSWNLLTLLQTCNLESQHYVADIISSG